jgi:hypothetical protein
MKTAFLATLALSLIIGSAALAQNRPSGGSNGYQNDPVTGYLCVTPACDVVRLPVTNCICSKTNPAARTLSETRLQCSIRENGQWVQCPVPPRYGG